MIERRRVSAVFSDFEAEINRLIRLDGINQQRYRAGPGRPGQAVLSRGQMILITEGVFIRAFSSYEVFLEDLFVLYARGKTTISGTAVPRFIIPKDGLHARDLIRSNMNFLEWNSPDVLIQRAETYLDGGPIKQSIVQYKTSLDRIRRIRNAIAHRSDVAWQRYTNIVSAELKAPQLMTPEPGYFLMMANPSAQNQHFLLSYLLVLKDVAKIATA